MTAELDRLHALLRTVSDAAEFSLDREDYADEGGTATHWVIYAENYGDWHNRNFEGVSITKSPLVEYRESLVSPKTEWNGQIDVNKWSQATGLASAELAKAIKDAKASTSGVPVMITSSH